MSAISCVGADARRGADREINRAEAIRSAIDEVAEKDDRPLLAKSGLARGLVEERAQEIGPPVNIADGENLHVRAHAARQRKSSTLDNCGHRIPCAKLRRRQALHAGAG